MGNATTDVTAAARKDTLRAPFSTYRLVYYFIDIVRNFLCNPESIRDERLQSLLYSYNVSPEGIGRIITAAPPYTEDTRESGTTPAIRISSEELQIRNDTGLGALRPVNTPSGWSPMGMLTNLVSISLKIAVVSEKYQENLLLSDALLELFLFNANNIVKDCGIIDSLQVIGAAGPTEIPIGQAGNAKNCFQREISLQATSNYNCIVDTQGPTFRGIRATLKVQ